MVKEIFSFRQRFDALKLAVKWTYRSSKVLTLTILLVTVFGGLLTIIEPYVFKLIIDGLISGKEVSFVFNLGIGLLGVLLVYGIARIIEGMMWDVQTIIKKVHSQKLDKYIARQIMDKVSSLDSVYFENPQYYNTLQKASQNLWRINDFFWQFSFLLGEVASVLVIITALFTFNFSIVVLIMLAAIPSILLTFRKTRLEWGIFDAYSPLSRQANYYRTLLSENPQAIKEIKLFGLKEHFLTRFDKLFGDFIKKQENAARKQLWLLFLIGILEGVFSVLAAWLVIRAFLINKITIGQVTFYWTLLFQFAAHARFMVRQIGNLNENSVFMTPFLKVFSFEPSIKEIANAKEFPKIMKKNIEFKNVTFYYPRSKVAALKNFNLAIKPGESIALVGENGSGKTTLIKLLTRLYDVKEGAILIDGVNIKNISLRSLYENIGVIFQDFMKYEALVEENIGYGELRKLRKKGEIHTASVRAEAWEFIKNLEKQYRTHVGKTLHDEGVELSAGQWQKIALARAFFKNAQILCLDEPTAAVDAKAEYKLFQKFKKLTRNKTTVLISHRFSTVRMADKIVVMHRGKIVEHGSHKELLRKNGLYAKLFRMQAEGYLEN